MMRVISSEAAPLLEQKLGTEPINIVQIIWSDGTSTYFSDKTYAGCEPAILDMSPFEQILTYEGNTDRQQISVTLSDYNGTLKKIMDSEDIHKKQCRIYQSFDNIPLSDAFELFRGQISTPLTWREGERTVSFSVLSIYYSREAGFSPDEGQFNYVPEHLANKPWPLCFGSVVHVPAAQAGDIATGTSTRLWGLQDYSLPYKLQVLKFNRDDITKEYYYLRNLEVKAHVSTLSGDIKSQVLRFSNVLTQFSFSMNINGLQTKHILIDNLDSDYSASIAGTISAGTYGITPTFTKETVKQFSLAGKAVSVSKLNNFTYRIEGWKYPIGVGDINGQAWVDCVVSQIEIEGITYDQNYLDSLILQAPTICKNRYIDTIIEEDNNKQEIEDLQEVLDTIEVAYAEQVENYKLDANQDTYKSFKKYWDLRSKKMVEYLQKTQLQNLISYDKDKAEMDIEHIQHVFELIGKIRARQRILAQEYAKLSRHIEAVQTSINEQARLLKKFTTIKDYQNFPQGRHKFQVRNHVFEGILLGNVLSYEAPVSNYVNIEIAKRESDELDAFWIKNPKNDINLTGLYCRINGTNGRIIKVSEQIGNKCKFSLVSRRNINRSDSQEIRQSGQNQTIIKTALGDILTGNESLDEIFYIANTIPKNISDSAMARLRGTKRDQIIRLVAVGSTLVAPSAKNANGKNVVRTDRIAGAESPYASFKLSYNGFITETIYITDSAETIKSKIMQSSPLRGNMFDVTGGPLCSSETGEAEDIVISPLDPTIPFAKFEVIEVDVEHYPQTIALNYIINKQTLIIDSFFDSDGAQEYTGQQREAKMYETYNKSQYGADFAKLKKDIIELNEIIAAEGPGAGGQSLNRSVLKNNINQFVQLIQNVEVPVSQIQEVYKLISDQEFKNIFTLELMQYGYMLRYVNNLGNALPDPADSYYFTGRDINKISDACGVIPEDWLTPIQKLDRERFIQETLLIPDTQALSINVGDRVTKPNDYQVQYVANLIPSSIKAIYANRVIDGIVQLVPLPMTYYVKNENLAYGEYNITAVFLRRPLSEYEDENWQDGIFVSLESGVGPNPVDTITWLVQKYTTLEIDTTSFNAVKTKLTKYPANFALLEKKESLDLIKDIAYQARCSVYVRSGKIYIKYLPEEPDANLSLTVSDIALASLVLNHTDSENLITKYTATWRPDYYLEDEYKIILRHNLKRYGEIKDSYNYYTLTDRELVLKTATFWLIRNANTWKKVSFSGFMKCLQLEAYDTVELDVSHISDGPIKGLVESVSYNSDTHLVDLTIWLPIRAGEMVKYNYAWPMSVSDEFPDRQTILDGNAGNDINVTVPSGSLYDPADPTTLTLRPKDYGSLKLNDSIDSLPPIPTADLQEITYALTNLGNVTVEIPELLASLEDFSTPTPQAKEKPQNKKLNKALLYGTIEEIISVEETELDVESNNIRTVKALFKVKLNEDVVFAIFVTYPEVYNSKQIYSIFAAGTKVIIVEEKDGVYKIIDTGKNVLIPDNNGMGVQ